MVEQQLHWVGCSAMENLILNTAYPALYFAIGRVLVEAEVVFNVPDFRGLF